MLETTNFGKSVSSALTLLLIMLASFFFIPATSDAAVTRIQSATGNTGANAVTSFAVTLGSAPQNGHTLVAIISTRGTSTGRVTSIAQTGATWTRAVEAANASGSTIEIWYAPNVSAASKTITINQASLMSAAVVMEYDGVLTVSPLDKTASSNGTTTTASTGTTTATAQAAEIAVGGVGLVSSAYTLASITNSFSTVATSVTTNTTAANNALLYALEKVLTATGTVTTGGTVSNSSAWSGAIATFKETGPIAGPVTVTPNYNGYISSSPTITTAFSSSYAISSCEYTTNGSAWSAGTFTGTVPNFTCNATPTALSGTLSINMRATTASTGTGTGTAVARTIDLTPPVDGSLTVLAGNPDVGIFWTAAAETGSGLNHYDVYFQAGATAPACGSGTLIYTGKWLTFTHTGRAASTQYSYRVCATDNIGNVSSGIFGTITTTARPSIVNSCTACHGNPPVDNASRVGGTTGQFPGSHNRHSGSGTGQYTMVCTTCHINNTTLNHANGNIDISLSTGSYSLGTHAVSNTVSPGTCSNTYCHSAGTGGTSQSGDTRAIATNTSPAWGGTKTCYTCHGTSADVDGRPQYATGSPKSNDHLKVTHSKQACTVCHDSILSGTSGSYVMDPSKHNNGSYNIKASMGYTYALGGGTCATSGCHVSAQWGVSTLGCVQCHAATITRTKGRPGAILANVVSEFGLAWGHKKSGRAAVSDDDCCVCHLEGDGTNHKPTAYHQDGNIDLRDPDGAGETPITNMSNAAWTFQRYSTSFAAGTRTTTGHTANTIDNIITQKFCVKCHDSNGATNPTARSNNGGTGSATMPFGGIALGSTYTASLNAIGTQGLVDVATQFATTNSTRHPVLGPRTRDFPYSTKLASPYNNIGTARDANGTTGHTTASSVVIYCDDCHNASTPKTLRTVTAHGSDAANYLRGTIYASQPTLCTTCHTGYYSTTAAVNHGTGSAFASAGDTHNAAQNCHYCHGSNTGTTAPSRPQKAQDYHGSNALVGGGLWPTINARPVAFIRGWSGNAYHRGYSLSGTNGYAAGSALCGGGTCPGGGSVQNNTTGSTAYTAGGSY